MMKNHCSSVFIRKNIIIGPPENHEWWADRAGIVSCLPLSDNLWRLWFCGVDSHKRGGILSMDVDPSDDMRVIELRDHHHIARGAEGSFGSLGVMPDSVAMVDGALYMWYTGLYPGTDAPYGAAIGLAVSHDNGLSFKKVAAPVLKNPDPSLFVATSCVRHVSNEFHMWFARSNKWQAPCKGKPEAFYDLHHATSRDGINWDITDVPTLDLNTLEEIRGLRPAGIVRPWVSEDLSTIWFCARGGVDYRQPSEYAYRIFSASLDGHRVRPETIQQVSFTPEADQDEWDGWMRAYPSVMPFRDTRIMFYCGNYFGKHGFGYAVEQVTG